MSPTRLAIILAALALMSAAASAQVGIRIGGGGIGLGLMGPPLLGRDRSDGVERHRTPQRSEHVRRKQNDDDDVKTAKKTPAQERQEAEAPKVADTPKVTEAQNENSSVSSIAPDKDGLTTTPSPRRPSVVCHNENSTITGAAFEHNRARSGEDSRDDGRHRRPSGRLIGDLPAVYPDRGPDHHGALRLRRSVAAHKKL